MAVDYDSVKEYWDEFYNTKQLGVEDIPSQFAVFALSEFANKNILIDIGCGSGRDTFFFARHIDKVIGLDGSKGAIDYCKNKQAKYKISNCKFKQFDLSNLDACLEYIKLLSNELANSLLYARFFLHAIDDDTEYNFLQIAKYLSEHGGDIAVEFRTNRDELQQKFTHTHYRRYIHPLHFMERARKMGLSLSYFTEGFGFAKYKTDDAHVARFLFQPVSRVGQLGNK